eukprot:CAMPEP_0205939038 /NCGR_PEP_ID=MMETSP1325-20131115/48559_1 /ASSEMBLY_ACC=CAM_ASM_000708 /TAXON_ID=236786 /ORGANISM="Florenciella sp., Strain RCC1007" /LENGTH=68 /DNA_ID=CAMNT_0053309453 /DNA_START=252 /DNA_END=455 /DNA_ORIENTATION=-
MESPQALRKGAAHDAQATTIASDGGGSLGGAVRSHVRSRSTGDPGVTLLVDGNDGSARQHNSIEADRL